MTVLCVGAHPDDEVLGVGGTLARHAADGETVSVLLLGDGEMARHETETEAARERREERRREARAAGEVLGVESVRILDYWGNQLDDVALIDVVRDVERAIADVEPTTIYTHYSGDLNVDHQLVARAVRTAARPVADTTVDRILSFETPSSTELAIPTENNPFQPSTFVDITETMEAKMEAIDVYGSEMRDRPHPRSPDSLRANARLWGDRSGFRAAEPFEVVLDRRR
ncbi:PIG-L deacetylase family protein [Saliphagus sp. LR7]|uniref:PIG-L deacetylase family protein n=1 Tax=Saliphagus sp. LR7 TaxID=2282654 RepID=UPI000DF82ECB|nr:PIG-L deacetylase family protein [Saliphagus sp. LR7]